MLTSIFRFGSFILTRIKDFKDHDTTLNLDLFTPYSATVLKRPMRKAHNKQQLFRPVLTVKV